MSNHYEMPEQLRQLLFGDVHNPGLFYRLNAIEEAIAGIQESLVDRGITEDGCACPVHDDLRNIPSLPQEFYRVPLAPRDDYHASLN